jgi:hypothetical protein
VQHHPRFFFFFGFLDARFEILNLKTKYDLIGYRDSRFEVFRVSVMQDRSVVLGAAATLCPAVLIQSILNPESVPADFRVLSSIPHRPKMGNNAPRPMRGTGTRIEEDIASIKHLGTPHFHRIIHIIHSIFVSCLD